MSGQSVTQATVINAAAPNPNQSMTQLSLFKADGTPYAIPTKQAAQVDSVAADVATLKTDFNALLAKLRLAGILT